ncbi:MAG: NADH-quinone oxidoreductase subunit NuoE [Phycisphaeraceae bacterium]|nr:NADH-quinone oxidoreductase subunit NuoE [Phycisphaeraceae bacterium]
MKNSGTAEIERREEPYLDAALQQELESDVLVKYPNRRAAALPVLHAVQHKHGYLPFQALEEVGEFLGVPAAEIYDTATFYEEFFLEPRGEYVIWVCQSISCELLGHDSLLDKVRDKLGIEPGETTEDGRFTLMTAECLGSCGTAPVALVNEKLHENLTADNLDTILDELD